MSTLTNFFISDTYKGLLHASGVQLPASGKAAIFDGQGQQSALSLGILNQGADISGNLSTDSLNVGTLTYPSTNGTVGAFLYQQTATTIGRLDKITSEYLANVNPGPTQTYSIITSLTINTQGQVTGITTSEPTVSNHTTVTRTRYRLDADNPVFLNVTANNWQPVSINVPSTAKAAICFAKIDATFATEGDQIVTVYASSTNSMSRAYPILFLRTTQGRNIGVGSQFTIPITDDVVYITVDNNGSSGQAWPVVVTLLGYQE